ncbi:hypothetical protein MVEN_01113600 [Mycena venus]|uniref:Uncharacterized protein n=1 Tax=Mycena venus TaxID=2733690 RepID=A0A8H6Y8T0_9AGAR|nr:hypothetical protein MVEN_01113600 [Mycena venus]
MAILDQNSYMMENLHTRSGRAVVIAALCICAEQTFFAQSKPLSTAFSRAFHAYLSSTIKAQVESDIATLLLQDYEEVTKRKLTDIITRHKFRIPVDAA